MGIPRKSLIGLKRQLDARDFGEYLWCFLSKSHVTPAV